MSHKRVTDKWQITNIVCVKSEVNLKKGIFNQCLNVNFFIPETFAKMPD